MPTLKDAAEKWKAPPKIQDLQEIPITIEIFDDGVGVNDEGKEYNYSYIEIGEKSVRIPDSVISQLQEQLKANPKMRAFKVSHNGKTGFQSKYTVIPII